MSSEIYFDYAASAPLEPASRQAAVAALDLVGNPSATHSFGRSARAVADEARRQVASLIRAEPAAIVFTAGATEANATAINAAWVAAGEKGHVLVSAAEHPSVRAAVDRLVVRGAEIEILPIDRFGAVTAEAVISKLRPETALVAVMAVNNVLGTIQPTAGIGAAVAAERARRGPGGRPIWFHCDAVQAVPWFAVRPTDFGADTLAFSGHKIGGPKGIGALYVREGLPLSPLIVGGGQESGRRSGTENLAGIAGFGAAAEISVRRREAAATSADGLRRRLMSALAPFGSRLTVMSPPDGVPGIVYVTDRRLSGDELALRLDAAGIAVSSGAACAAGARKASPVLTAAWGEVAARHGGIRVSFGGATPAEDIDSLVSVLRKVLG